ncbi:MAG: hypothetical protein HN826_00250 [Methylococcales bacterium]|nr:hypothetical protein [Methylococcales bacterium]
MSTTQPSEKLIQSVNDLHQWIGLVLSIIILFLAITGILINHSAELELNQQPIKSKWLLNWYGVKLPEIKTFRINSSFISSVNHQLYFNEKPLKISAAHLNGAILFDEFIAVSTDNSLILLTHQGEIIEQLNKTHGIPKKVLAIGTYENLLVLRNKNNLLATDQDFLQWHQILDHNITWAQTSNLSSSIRENISQNFLSHSITLERLMQDIHSGRFFGSKGVLFMDLATLLFIILALTGVWIYLKSSRQKKQFSRKTDIIKLKKTGQYSIVDLNPGDTGEILQIQGDINTRKRLAEMGMITGTKVAVSATSLLGDPRSYIIRGLTVTMRNDEAANILLHPKPRRLS